MSDNRQFNKSYKLNSHGQAVAAIAVAFAVMVFVIFTVIIAPSNRTDVSDDSTLSQIVSDASSDESSGDSTLDVSTPDESSEESINDETLLEYYQSAALYCCVINAKTGTVMYSKNADQKAYPASITKLMTACVMLKYCEGDEVFTAGDEVKMIGEGSSIAYILEGHRLTVNMLVDAMLLPSGNDAAYVVAVNVARKVSGDDTLTNEEAVAYFAGLMNQEAASLGCTGTHFCNPDGYHNDDHYSTAADLALICQYARTYETICESVAKESVSVVYESGQTNTWYNTNYLLTHTTYSGEESKWYKPYVTGMKTGKTDKAGSCIAISAEKDGLSVIAIVLNCSSMTARYNEAFRLMEAIYGEDE